jgi:hypothetical protein
MWGVSCQVQEGIGKKNNKKQGEKTNKKRRKTKKEKQVQ